MSASPAVTLDFALDPFSVCLLQPSTSQPTLSAHEKSEWFSPTAHQNLLLPKTVLHMMSLSID
jgi:hypothetical protein